MSTVVDPDTNEHEVVAPDEAAAAAPEVHTCPNCGAPADPGQLMCLECGSRLALDYQRPPTWRLPALIVGVVVLLAGLGVAIAIAAGDGNSTTTTATPPGSTTQPAPSPAGDSPPTASQPTTAPTTGSTTTPAPATGGTTATTPTTTAPAT